MEDVGGNVLRTEGLNKQNPLEVWALTATPNLRILPFCDFQPITTEGSECYWTSGSLGIS